MGSPLNDLVSLVFNRIPPHLILRALLGHVAVPSVPVVIPVVDDDVLSGSTECTIYVSSESAGSPAHSFGFDVESDEDEGVAGSCS